ncbi:MAG: response regulator [Proteobacteria bacterium]|nr:response regulator [Pseudomonadota bacterium]
MKLGIKTKILLIMLLVAFIPGIVGSLSTYFKGSSIFIQGMGVKFQELSREITVAIDTLIQKGASEGRLLSLNKNILHLINETETGKVLETGIVDQYLSDYLDFETNQEGHANVSIYNIDGEMLYSHGPDKITSPLSQDSLKLLKKGGKQIVIGNFFKEDYESYLLPIHAPVLDSAENSLRGFLTIHLNVDKFFSNVFETTTFGDTGHMNLVSSDGTVFYDPLLSGGADPFPDDIIKSIMNAGEPWFIGIDEHGLEALIAFSPLDFSGTNVVNTDNRKMFVVLTQAKHEALDKPISSVLLSAAIPGFILASLLVFIFYLAMKKVVQPISVLKNSVSIIGRGNLDHRIDIHTGDEIEALAVEFNMMASELKGLYSGLEEKVRERTLELEASNKKLQKASKLKSEFLANMSHELRTPLNSIIGFSEVLYDGLYGEQNDRQKKYLDNIHKSGRHLLDLINGILDLSKIESGKMELSLSEFPLSVAVDEVRSIINPLAGKKNITLSFSMEKEIDTIIADRLKLKQILYNLLGNAIKFTTESGSVNVHVRKQEEFLEFSVADSGIGIEEDAQDLIFESFRQVDGSHSRDYEGTGLGLTLTKKFVEMHGGKIWVESKIGKGSTFFFTIAMQQALPQGQEGVADYTVKPPAYLASQENTSNDPGQNKLVLVVEDNKDASHLISMYLKEGGYDVVKAFSGEDALKLAVELKPFAITLDIMLPKKDGWEVLKELKANELTTNIPVVIVSMVDNKELGYAMGALDTCTKPISKKGLLKILARHTFTTKVTTGKISVLIVDDDPQCLELLSSILEPIGFTVIKASGGKKAIELARANNPDLMILDLMMPEVSGFDVVHEMKMNAKTREIPIMILTAKEVTEEDKKVLNGHIERIIEKATFNKEFLLKEMKSIEKRVSID